MAFSAVSNRAFSLFVTLVVVLGIIINSLDLSEDPYRCKALLHEGSWINPPDENGSRDPFSHWQPRGCMMHQYKKEEIQQCMEGRPMYFFGDSTTRQIYYGMARLLDREKAEDQRKHSHKHGIHDTEFGDVRLRQVWIPLMEAGDARVDVDKQLLRYRDEKLTPAPVQDQQSAAFIFMGVGIWYAARMDEGVSLEEFKHMFNNVTDLIGPSDLPEFGTEPMTNDGVGSQFFVAPPAPPFFDGMPDSRKTGKATRPGELEAIDEYLASVEAETNINMLWSYPALSHEQPGVIADPKNGFHVTDTVAEVKANILLNLRCNAKLDAQQSYPYDRTCCTDYGRDNRNLSQMMVLGAGMLYVALTSLIEITFLLSGQSSRWGFFNSDVSIFVTALLACYWADRTQSFAKGAKEYVPLEFQVLIGLAVVVGLCTFKKSKPPPPKPGSTDTPAELEDMKPLSRDQTDEWKGWMQAVILIYHWTGASRILDIYIVVRLLVAAYLFQTGYGHAVFFITKKDFSFKRVASVMLRLNLLSCALPYIMNTQYIYYYFAPLVSFWFMAIYATFAIGRRYNDENLTLFLKLLVSMAIFPGLMLCSPAMGWVFTFLKTVFRIEWDLQEWQFRLGLDWFVVYAGMMMGIASVRTKFYNQVLTQSRGQIGLLGAIALPVYCVVASQHSEKKQDYNAYHPYLSFLPILFFIAARNINKQARTWYSTGFAWLGRCSLETFTLQFHIFLAADTKGVLLLDLFQGDGGLFSDRWRALVIVVPMFLWISSRVADATGAMVKMLISEAAPDQDGNSEFDVESKADSEPLMGSNSWYNNLSIRPIVSHIPARKSWISSLKTRMLGLFVLLWVLNFASAA